MSLGLNVANEFPEILKIYYGLNKIMPVKKKANNPKEKWAEHIH